MKSEAFHAIILVVVLFSVFTFYFAIETSFATRTGLFEINYWLKQFPLPNYVAVPGGRTFPRNILKPVFIATSTVAFALFLGVTASFALARVRFRGRACC
jgi:trehalose/maltose transport system permease protein